jgi:hypothetical protein
MIFYQRDSKGHHGHFDDQTAAFRKAPPATEKLNLHHSVGGFIRGIQRLFPDYWRRCSIL